MVNNCKVKQEHFAIWGAHANIAFDHNFLFTYRITYLFIINS